VGPGDPELLTLKGARVLREVDCICVPRGREEGASLALSIVRKVVGLEGKEIIQAYFPMMKTVRPNHHQELHARWHETVTSILERLDRGIHTAFITIGDPAIYSTFFYLYDRLLEADRGLRMEIIPGVSSINASASLAGIPLGLGNERIAILPANYLGDLKTSLQLFDTVVLMKVNKVFPEIVALLAELEVLDQAVYVSRAGMVGETVCSDLSSLKTDDLDYFSLIIVRKPGGIE
jgi:precorrin-2/cobalt-factor-2 C20-methyltransferase